MFPFTGEYVREFREAEYDVAGEILRRGSQKAKNECNESFLRSSSFKQQRMHGKLDVEHAARPSSKRSSDRPTVRSSEGPTDRATDRPTDEPNNRQASKQ